jgi:hypothetical protein
MTEFADFQSLLDDGVPEVGEVKAKFEELRMPLAGRYFHQTAAKALAEAYEGDPPASGGPRYRNSDFLIDCYGSGSLTQTLLPETLEEDCVALAQQAATETLEEIQTRISNIMARDLHDLHRFTDGLIKLAQEVEDQIAQKVTVIQQKIADWNGDGGNYLQENFGDNLPEALQNHRDMAMALAFAADNLAAVQIKANKYLDEMANTVREALYTKETDDSLVLPVAIIAGGATIASAATGGTLPVIWATVAGAAATLPAAFDLSTTNDVVLSNADIDALVSNIYGAFDAMEEVMAEEQRAFAGELNEFIGDLRDFAKDSDPSVSSKVITRPSSQS